MKQLKYDYTKLDKFLEENFVFHEAMSECFLDIWSAYTQMTNTVLSEEKTSMMCYYIGSGANNFEFFYKLSKILEELPEIKGEEDKS